MYGAYPAIKQLRDEALSADRWNRLHPESDPRVPHVVAVLRDAPGPVIAATDFMKTIPDLIRPWVMQRYVALGTDGYGRSDTREALRRFFEVDAESIAIAALHALALDGLIPTSEVAAAIRDLGIDPEKPDPLNPPADRQIGVRLDISPNSLKSGPPGILIWNWGNSNLTPICQKAGKSLVSSSGSMLNLIALG